MNEEDNEIEEYELIEEPETTRIVRKKVEGLDSCPFCGSEDIGKDFRKNIYVCFECRRTWVVKR